MDPPSLRPCQCLWVMAKEIHYSQHYWYKLVVLEPVPASSCVWSISNTKTKMRILSYASRRFQITKNYYIPTTGYRDSTGTVLAPCWKELEHVQLLQAQAANAFQNCNIQWGFHQRHQGSSISPPNVTFWQLGTKILWGHESFVTQWQSYTTNCYNKCNQFFSKVNYSFPILQRMSGLFQIILSCYILTCGYWDIVDTCSLVVYLSMFSHAIRRWSTITQSSENATYAPLTQPCILLLCALVNVSG